MARIACFTSFTYGYLARARVLALTLKQVHPDWELWALLVDKPPAELPPAALAPFDHVMDADALDIPRFAAWMFKHDLVEACTAVKGAMLCHLLDRGADIVVYLDPDIAVFHPLDAIAARLGAASIMLTPHQTVPNTTATAIADNELGSMQYGIFNLGFLAVRNDPTGRAFAQWWAGMLHTACYDAVETGLFTDQKYCDLAPALFERVHIERSPGFNVASWNLSQRRLRFDADGGLLADGEPLKFYHFTKIGGVGDLMTARYARDNVEVYELVNWYKRQLARNSYPAAAAHPWHYACFADGTPIPLAARVAFRNRFDVMAAFDDPFALGEGTFHHWLTVMMPGVLGLSANG